MIPNKLTLSTAQDMTMFFPQCMHTSRAQIKDNVIVQQKPSCRICLDQCEDILFCRCKGSSMVHQKCLKQYILKGHGSLSSRSKCQICNQSFKILLNKTTSCSCSNGLNQLRQNRSSSIIFLVYCLITMTYIAYCSYMNSHHQLNNELQLILLIIGICLIIIMLAVIIKWSIHNMIIKKVILQKILSLEQQNTRKRNLSNATHNSVNNTTIDNFLVQNQ